MNTNKIIVQSLCLMATLSLLIGCGSPEGYSSGGSGAKSSESSQSMRSEEQSTIPREGEPAPDFTLPASTGETISLSDYEGEKHVVLYFYPKDDTPGCTKQACSFRDDMSQFEQRDAVVLGVSVDDLESHDMFVEKYNLPFPLLADTNYEAVEKYGAKMVIDEDDEQFVMAKRMTFIIDKNGIIRKVYPDVEVIGHSADVLNVLDTLQ